MGSWCPRSLGNSLIERRGGPWTGGRGVVRRERRRRVSVCGGRGREHAPTPKPSPKRQRNPATASRPRWGLYPRAARGWGAHLGARVGLCTGPRRWPGQGRACRTCDRHESDASAGRGRAMRVAMLAMVRGVGSQRGTKELQNQQVPWAAPQPMAVARACWAEGRPERRPRVVRRACFQLGRATELPTDAQTARRAPKTTTKAQAERPLLASFWLCQGGGGEGKATRLREAIPIRGSGSPTQSR